MELHGEGDHDQVAEVSGATSPAYAGGKEIQPPASHKYSVLWEHTVFPNPAPAGLTRGSTRGSSSDIQGQWEGDGRRRDDRQTS